MNEEKLKEFYFSKFENRKPYQAIPDNRWRTYLFHFFAINTISVGLIYIIWRWRFSINMDNLWFAIPLVVAETLSLVGTVLIIINYWSNKDPQPQIPIHYLSEIEDLNGKSDRPISIDIFIATYNEDVELVRYSIRDAVQASYPFSDVPIQVYVLDDGKRDGTNSAIQNMKAVTEQEGAKYLSRENNLGFKAGNLKNGLENSNGDLFVILDADTRPFKNFLINTIGYFRNKKLAWVQTPQWFYDTTEKISIKDSLKTNTNFFSRILNKITPDFIGKVGIGEDIFGNDPRIFYDVLLRRRNFFNASFCCGAGSIHRREAILSLALRDFGLETKSKINFANIKRRIERTYLGNYIKEKLSKNQKQEHLANTQLIPFKFHASEDIYTSLMLHTDKINKWESIQHPNVECKMLSPQDLDTWVKQRTRYAQGSLDIALKNNPLFIKGLSAGQRLSYFTTIYSYFAPLWIIVFLLSPIIFFYFQALPVRAYSFDFFKYFIPFQVLNTVVMTIGCWGIQTGRGDQYYISCFWLMFLSMISVVRGKKVKFNVTSKNRVLGNNFVHIYPHVILIVLTLTGIIYNIILIAFYTHPSVSGFFSNSLWGLFNVYNLSIIVRAAYWKPSSDN